MARVGEGKRKILNGRKTGWWKTGFLTALAVNGNVSNAAAAAGVSRKTAYQAKKRSKAFRDLWDEAIEVAGDNLEAMAFKRASEGWTEPGEPGEPEKGKKPRHRRSYPPSDNLLIFLLKHNKPKKYGSTQRIELTGAAGGPIEMTDDEQAQLKLLSSDPEAMAAMRILAERRQALEEKPKLNGKLNGSGNGKLTH